MDLVMVKDAILNGYEGSYTNSHKFPCNFLSKEVFICKFNRVDPSGEIYKFSIRVKKTTDK